MHDANLLLGMDTILREVLNWNDFRGLWRREWKVAQLVELYVL